MRPCAACGGRARKAAFHGRDWYVGAVASGWDYHRCTSCGSVYADPQPTDAELDAAYAASYGPYRESPTLLERLGEPLGRREAARFAALAGGGTLVDVGCGGGAMLRRFQAVGWEGDLRGIEMSPDVAGRTAARLGIAVEVAAIEAVALPPAGADAIVLRHVIEHVREPLDVLGRLRDGLRPGGHIYVATPDRRALAERVFGRYWHGYDPPRHLYAFTRDGVRQLLARAGFELIEERWDFAPQMWVASLHHLLRSTRLAARADTIASMFNPLVAAPAVAGGALEWLLRRTTMYGATARRAGA